MEWAKTILDFIGSLAWPALLLFFVLYFRNSITSLLDRLKSAEVAGNKFQFSEELKKAEVETSAAVEVITQLREYPGADIPGEPPLTDEPQVDSDHNSGAGAGTPTPDKGRGRLAFAKESPSSLVAISWRRIDDAVARLWLAVGKDDSELRALGPKTRVKILGSVLQPELSEALDSMRTMHGEVVRGRSPVSEAEALAYAENADRLVQVIEDLIEIEASRQGS